MMGLGKLFGAGPNPAPPELPSGFRIYAIGDVHGRHDLLDELLALITTDSDSRRQARLVLVFLGDLIDRGPQSAEVVERLRTLRVGTARLVFLAGNHEEVLLRILDGDAALIADWLRFGGAECLRSYGADPDRIRQMTASDAVAAVRTAIPAEHVAFLRTFDDTFRAGDYLFVHAGVRPGLPLAEQDAADLRWIREPFLSHQADHGFVVVHGHTIREQVEERPNRIGIDTGAYRHGILTALGLEGRDRWLLQATTGPTGVDTAEESALDGVGSQSG